MARQGRHLVAACSLLAFPHLTVGQNVSFSAWQAEPVLARLYIILICVRTLQLQIPQLVSLVQLTTPLEHLI